jgi:hypothetical protein
MIIGDPGRSATWNPFAGGTWRRFGDMAGIFNKVSAFARSPQGKKLLKQAQDAAKDPKNRAKLQELGDKLKDPKNREKVQELGNKLKDAARSSGSKPAAPRPDPDSEGPATGPRPDPDAPKAP